MIDLREVVATLERYQERMWAEYGKENWPEGFPALPREEMRQLLKVQGLLCQVIGKRDSFFLVSNK